MPDSSEVRCLAWALKGSLLPSPYLTTLPLCVLHLSANTSSWGAARACSLICQEQVPLDLQVAQVGLTQDTLLLEWPPGRLVESAELIIAAGVRAASPDKDPDNMHGRYVVFKGSVKLHFRKRHYYRPCFPNPRSDL